MRVFAERILYCMNFKMLKANYHSSSNYFMIAVEVNLSAYAFLNKNVFKFFLKVSTDAASRRLGGRVFHN